jgi:host factor-I protein
MPQTSDSTPASTPNIQDVFLNHARRERLTVGIRLMNGAEVEARIKNFDRFAVIVEHDGTDLLVFKHAIASIRAPKTMQSYYTPPQG